MKKFLVVGIISAIILIAILTYIFIPKEVHEHADFAIFINDERVNFSRQEFMSDQTLLSERAHLHEMEGRLAHKHDSGITWSYLFSTIGMKLNSTCFFVDGSDYCNNETHRLRMFSNGLEVKNIEDYEIKELDRVLVTYGTEENIDQQLESVSDIACVFSNKCPEKGQAVGEGCITGSGNSCK